MGKLIFFILFLVVVVPALVQASIYFWQEVNRRRDKEDRLELHEQRKQALLEFKESQYTFDEFMKQNYSEVSVTKNRSGIRTQSSVSRKGGDTL